MRTKRTMTMTAFAKLRKVSRVTANTWRNRGLVVIVDGLVDVAASNKMLADRAETYRGGQVGGNAAKGAPDTSNGNSPLARSTAKAVATKETYLALMRQLDFHKAAGDVVDLEAVETAVAARYAVMRNRLMGLGSKVAMAVCATTDPAEKLRIINTELERALSCLDAHETFLELKRMVDEDAGIAPAEEDEND